LLPLLLFGLGAWALGMEIRYGSHAAHVPATILSWEPGFGFGFIGTAKVRLKLDGHPGESRDHGIKTRFWYKPGVGEEVPIVVDVTRAELGRPASLWQRFATPLLCIAVSIAWFLWIWRTGDSPAVSPPPARSADSK
jgi:hypothetical protein